MPETQKTPDLPLNDAGDVEGYIVPAGVIVDESFIGNARFAVAPDVDLADILWRVDSKATNGRARYISYIDARITALYLDLWVGPDGWEESYEEALLHGEQVLWCHLTLHFPRRSVVHSDLTTFKMGRGGSEQEKVAVGIKGYPSDAFKRAAAKAGIGRNVYRLPEIWAPVNDRGYPPDNIAEIIAAELHKRGLDSSEVKVDENSSASDEVDAATDWTMFAKTAIWNAAGRNDKVAVDLYQGGLARSKVTEPLTSEIEARDVITAAQAVAALITGQDTTEPPEAAPDEPQTEDGIPVAADDEPSAVAEWVRAEGGDDPAYAYSQGFRRAIIVTTKHDVGSAEALWKQMTSDAKAPTPLTREAYRYLVDALQG